MQKKTYASQYVAALSQKTYRQLPSEQHINFVHGYSEGTSAITCLGATNVKSPMKDRTNIDFLTNFFIFLNLSYFSENARIAVGFV